MQKERGRMDLDDHACFICRKHRGLEAAPPGGYLYADTHWLVCHAPAAFAVPGQVFVEARRHWLDFAAMPPEEATTYGVLLQRVSAAIKHATGAERVYALTTIEDIPHFHAWLIPRRPDVAARGVAFLAEEHRCTEPEAVAAAEALRAALADGAGSA
jgi:diadenosine tetraphosphate (Ap4A) HIT family hydrolase